MSRLRNKQKDTYSASNSKTNNGKFQECVIIDSKFYEGKISIKLLYTVLCAPPLVARESGGHISSNIVETWSFFIFRRELCLI